MMDRKQKLILGSISALILLLGGALGTTFNAKSADAASTLAFEVSFPASAHPQPITGRVFIAISEKDWPEPRAQVGWWMNSTPLFGVDISEAAPGAPIIIDGSTKGYPLSSLNDIPAGDYYVQALVNIYTQFHRSDGHTLWAHMDQWEGQQFNSSPGNLYSSVVKAHLDPAQGYRIKLNLNKIIPPIKIPEDSTWVKRIKIQSQLLTKFWGRPMYLGAVVLLPRDYEKKPDTSYPTIYAQGHFGLEPPFGFSAESDFINSNDRSAANENNLESGAEFYQAWNSKDFPRMMAVTFQHPTPFFDDSYAVNSANNGPYADALLDELIPYLEEHFRMIRKPYARVLTGGSTGGWESLALQIHHPDFFGGVWSLYPDPVDFSRYQLVDIYDEDNAFYTSFGRWTQALRPLMRTVEGQPQVTIQQMSQLEEVLGSRCRSGQQLAAWEAAYGPVGEDGYPMPLWDKRTGKIDHEVARYMQDHNYDLAYYIRKNWAFLGPKLSGKINIAVGDMDNYYLNLAVYRLQEIFKYSSNPHYEGTFEYGRPMKGHGWQPWSNRELVRLMAEHVAQNSPDGDNPSNWFGK
jgi:hypothetical protein